MQNKDILNQKERLPLFPDWSNPTSEHYYRTVLANRMQYWESREDCAPEDVTRKAIEETKTLCAIMKPLAKENAILEVRGKADRTNAVVREAIKQTEDKIKYLRKDLIEGTKSTINPILWTTGILLAITDALLIALLTHLW